MNRPASITVQEWYNAHNIISDNDMQSIFDSLNDKEKLEDKMNRLRASEMLVYIPDDSGSLVCIKNKLYSIVHTTSKQERFIRALETE